VAVERSTGGRAVFIDKDGTLIHDVPYNVDPRRVQLAIGAGQALRRMKDEGYKLIVISNQSGVARGLFEEKDLLPINRQIQSLLAAYDVRVDAFYYCPHGPGDGCECRKPMPGMILQAARDNGVRPQISWMIGDILNDVEAGNRAGCRTIHLDNGNETEWVKGNYREPGYAAKDLMEAADIICHCASARERQEVAHY
jgi:histidinol-phosphate phosphatase family protein